LGAFSGKALKFRSWVEAPSLKSQRVGDFPIFVLNNAFLAHLDLKFSFETTFWITKKVIFGLLNTDHSS